MKPMRGALLTTVALLALATPLVVSAGPRPPEKTLKRQLDQVVVVASALNPLSGAAIERLRLLALNDGAFSVIPFQIDERTPSGGYAFDRGGETVRDVDGGALDANDELVFMARDTGDRASKAQLEAYPKQVEIEVRYPVNGARGWAYLAAFSENPPPRSRVDYVSINYEKSGLLTYHGHDFMMDNARALESVVRTTTIRYRGADGRLMGNDIDTTKTRSELYYFSIPIRRDGTDMRTSVAAFIDGPVRVVALNKAEVYLIWGIWVDAPDSLILYYDYGSEMPTNINVPINLDESPPSTGRLSLDFSTQANGWQYYNDRNLEPVNLDGVMSPREKKLDRGFPSWSVMFGPHGGVLQRMMFEDAAFTQGPHSGLYYNDDRTAQDTPENDPGSVGNSGVIVDLTGLDSGIYRGVYYTYYRSGFRYGDEAPFLDIIDRPLEVAVR